MQYSFAKFIALLPLIVVLRHSASAGASTQVPGPPQQTPIAIVGATVHVVSASPIECGTILFDEGRIVAVGTEVKLPEGTQQIDGTGKHVFPGMFCAGGGIGLMEINSVRATRDLAETGNINPNVQVKVAVNPDSELIPVTRANGVLLSLTLPTGGLISGMGAVLQLDGWTWEDMTLKSPAALHVNWPRFVPPGSQAGGNEGQGRDDDPLRRLEETFDRAEQYRRGRRDEAIDVRYEALIPVLERQVPIVASANTQRQIESAVAFANRRQLRLIVYGGYDAEQVADLLKEHRVPVILPAVYRLPYRRSDPYDAPYTLPDRLRRAGVRFCIAGVDGFRAPNLRNLPYHAATAVAYGLPLEDAFKAISLWPAEILGVDDRVGSLQAGKDATLFIADDHPFETATHVETAFIQGRRVDLGSRHQALWGKYREKYRQLRSMAPASGGGD